MCACTNKPKTGLKTTLQNVCVGELSTLPLTSGDQGTEVGWAWGMTPMYQVHVRWGCECKEKLTAVVKEG